MEEAGGPGRDGGREGKRVLLRNRVAVPPIADFPANPTTRPFSLGVAKKTKKIDPTNYLC